MRLIKLPQKNFKSLTDSGQKFNLKKFTQVSQIYSQMENLHIISFQASQYILIRMKESEELPKELYEMLSSRSGSRMIGYIRPEDKSKTPLVVAAREEQLLGFCVSVPSVKGEKQYFVDEEFLPEIQKDLLLLYDFFHLKLTKTSSIRKKKSIQGIPSDEEREEEQKEPDNDPDPSVRMDPEEDQRHLDVPPPSVQILSDTEPDRSDEPEFLAQDSSPENKNAESTPNVTLSPVLPKLRVRKDILMIDVEAETAGGPGVARVDNGMNLMRDCRFLTQEQQPSVIQHHRPRLPAVTTPQYQQVNPRPRYLILPRRDNPSRFASQSVSDITRPPGLDHQYRVVYSKISQNTQQAMSSQTPGPPRLGPRLPKSSAPRPPVPWTGHPPGPRSGPLPGPPSGARPLVIAGAPLPHPVISQQRCSTGNMETFVTFHLHFFF